ncbi:MAG: 50S ribosomal protein L15 [Methanospirillaceae archaeon]|nr:50S ribosomal protein L15 [Methanospirillaceae archaeon]
MPVNKRSKYRGSRTCGGGTHKNRRGAGNRGGRGNSGGCKHHFVRVYLKQGYVYGKHGFYHDTKGKQQVLDVGDIDQIVPVLLADGVARQEDGVVLLNADDIGIDKVLGGGKVTRKMSITAKAFSSQAVEKIEAKGGEAVPAA